MQNAAFINGKIIALFSNGNSSAKHLKLLSGKKKNEQIFMVYFIAVKRLRY